MSEIYSYFFGGDWHFFWQQSIHDLAIFPSAWDSFLNTGMGTPALNILWLNSYLNATAWISTSLHISWFWISLLFWILPPVFCGFIFAYIFFQRLSALPKIYGIVSAIIYTCNTYFLLVYTGGQLGVALAYSLLPAVMLRTVYALRTVSLRNSLINGLVFAIAFLIDPRIFLLDCIALLFLWVCFMKKEKLRQQCIYGFVIPFVTMVILNAFWILPFLLYPSVAVSGNISTTADLTFLSFAGFPQTFSLLHPNWPENIFGKTEFMNAAFLVLPLLAYSSLLFIDKTNSKKKNVMENSYRRYVLYFGLLGLVGAFMAKGVNEPFGMINVFLFDHIPSMGLFRDPAKFYLLIATAYAIVIPLSLYFLSMRFKVNKNIVIAIFLVYYLGLVFISSRGIIVKKFQLVSIPQEYRQLSVLLKNDTHFSRTLWYPKVDRYGYTSADHPAVSANELLSSSNQALIMKQLQSKNTLQVLQEAAIRYVVIPEDITGEIFSKDRKYDINAYTKAVKQTDAITYLQNKKTFGKIIVYTVPQIRDHFWTDDKAARVIYSQSSPTHYKVTVSNIHEGEKVIFAETFNSLWYANVSGNKIYSSKYINNLNSFQLPNKGTYSFDVFYKPQQYIYIGAIVSLLTLLGVFYFIVFKLKKL